MNDKDYLQGVRELLDTLTRQVGKLVCDIGLLNDIGIETNKRLKAAKAGGEV